MGRGQWNYRGTFRVELGKRTVEGIAVTALKSARGRDSRQLALMLPTQN